MIVEIDVTNTEQPVFELPHGRILRIRTVTITDESGAANEVKLYDKGNYYDGTNFNSTYTRTVIDEKVGANTTVYRNYKDNDKDVLNTLYAIGTGNAKVILDVELL